MNPTASKIDYIDSVYWKLEKIANKCGISVQELIRVVIVPDWLDKGQGH